MVLGENNDNINKFIYKNDRIKLHRLSRAIMSKKKKKSLEKN